MLAGILSGTLCFMGSPAPILIPFAPNAPAPIAPPILSTVLRLGISLDIALPIPIRISKNDLTVSDSNSFVDISWNIALSFPSLPVIESSDFPFLQKPNPWNHQWYS